MEQDELFPSDEYRPSVSLLRCEGSPETIVFIDGGFLGVCPGRKELFAWFGSLPPGKFDFNWQHVSKEDLFNESEGPFSLR